MSDRDELLVSLNSGRGEFLASLDGVTEEQAAAKPVTGWSILECAEHVAIVEENLRRRLMEQSTPTDHEMPRQREALIVARAADRGASSPRRNSLNRAAASPHFPKRSSLFAAAGSRPSPTSLPAMGTCAASRWITR